MQIAGDPIPCYGLGVVEFITTQDNSFHPLCAYREELGGEKSSYLSVDPAPPTAVSGTVSVDQLKDYLMDASKSLFDRYRAMFSLRNRAGGKNGEEAAVLALAEGFKDSSPLFRHEVAYVLGQVQSPASIPALKAVLENPEEHRMVRHEAAEALGAVGGEVAEKALKAYLGDSERVVRESCEVALDTIDYWQVQDFGGGKQSA